jgi:RecB family exonuclease
MAPAPFHVPTGSLIIENTDELREQLKRHTWSFSSLQRFFTCPCRFILEDIQGVEPPPCFAEEEHANLIIGDLLHRFFAEMKEHRPALERWREEFDETWYSYEDLPAKLPDEAVRKAIVESHLADIAAWEKETGRLLLFSDEVTETELELAAPFGGGRYQLKGRIDRLQREGDNQLIADLKYREKFSRKGLLADRVEEPDSFDDGFQLVIYAYLALRNNRATPGRLDAAQIFLRPRVRGDYEGRLAQEDLAGCDATMELIARRLDRMLAWERFVPNFRAAGCSYCPHKALCLKPDLYRTGGRMGGRTGGRSW